MPDITNFYKYLEHAGFDTKAHQVEGVKWCLANEVNGQQASNTVIRGGLIADDMGLGKTAQIIGVILCNFFKSGTLIVLPRALLEQWTSVLRTTAGHRPLVYHGYAKRNITLAQLKSAPIVLTTYGLVATRKNGKLSPLHEVKWKRVVFDEAHHLRNSATNIHQGALKLNAKIRWLITGTPIQNSRKDFYSLCSILRVPCGFYLDPSNKKAIIDSFILKRTKESVGITLPPLTHEAIVVDWKDDKEKQFAKDVHSTLQFSGVSGHSRDNSSLLNGMCEVTLVALLRARQLCVHPPLVRKKIKTLICEGTLEDDRTMYDKVKHSSKLDAVIHKINERKRNGNSKLVFCHFRGEIDALKNSLLKKGLDVKTFDGRTDRAERNNIITSNCDVLILQIQTGCEGLNLQQFNEVYFVSAHWNPAVEDQAVARCHRIGQTRPVHVFRFGMRNFDEDDETKTLDSYATEVQNTKREEMKFIDEDESNTNDKDNDNKDNDDECAICLSKPKDTMYLNCGHGFCKMCVYQMKQQPNLRQACPVCRAPF